MTILQIGRNKKLQIGSKDEIGSKNENRTVSKNRAEM